MKRILVLLIVTMAVLTGCAGGGKPTVAVTGSASAGAAAWSQPAWTPSAPPSVSVDAAGCAAARQLNAASAMSDFAAAGVELSRAQDGPLAEAGIRLAVEALGAVPVRSAVYARLLDVLEECLRVSP